MKAINNLYNESYKQLMQWKLYAKANLCNESYINWTTYDTMKAINNLYNESYKQLIQWKL